ncbi:hypothetical protein FHG87_020758 [Trinorchestia longiramus]|nr:hypothetical protein FHG87_020758 [Trinorchestia longiramus]
MSSVCPLPPTCTPHNPLPASLTPHNPLPASLTPHNPLPASLTPHNPLPASLSITPTDVTLVSGAGTNVCCIAVFLKVVRIAPLGALRKCKGGGRRVRLEWGAYITV